MAKLLEETEQGFMVELDANDMPGTISLIVDQLSAAAVKEGALTVRGREALLTAVRDNKVKPLLAQIEDDHITSLRIMTDLVVQLLTKTKGHPKVRKGLVPLARIAAYIAYRVAPDANLYDTLCLFRFAGFREVWNDIMAMMTPGQRMECKVMYAVRNIVAYTKLFFGKLLLAVATASVLFFLIKGIAAVLGK